MCEKNLTSINTDVETQLPSNKFTKLSQRKCVLIITGQRMYAVGAWNSDNCHLLARPGVPASLVMQIQILWVVKLRWLINSYRRFGGAFFLHP